MTEFPPARTGMSERSLPPTTLVPLGDGWAGSSVNGSAFRCEGLVTSGNIQVGAWYDADGAVSLFHRDIDGGRLTVTAFACETPPWDAHRSISLGLDPLRRIHVAFGAHAGGMLYARGDANLDIRSVRPTPLGGTGASMTYPMFLNVGTPEQLFMLYREGGAESGDIRAKRLDTPSAEWIDLPRPLLQGALRGHWAGPYLNRPLVAPDGTVFAFCVWRLRLPPEPSNPVINSGIDLFAFRRQFESVETLSGLRLQNPAGAVHAERVVAVALGHALTNQAGAALHPSGMPAAVTWWREQNDLVPQYRLVICLDGRWHGLPASRFTTPFTLGGVGTLALPHSRPQLLFAPDGRAIIVFRSVECQGGIAAHILAPPAYELIEVVHLWEGDLGHYEPIIDYAAWRTRNVLSMMVQRCEQQPGDTARDSRVTAPIHIAEWPARTLLRPPN